MKIIVWVVSPIVPGEPLMLTLFVNWVTGMCLPELQKSLLVMSMSGISITREIAKTVMRIGKIKCRIPELFRWAIMQI